MRNRKIQNIANHALNLLNAWVAEFENMITVAADQVIVLTKRIGFFET